MEDDMARKKALTIFSLLLWAQLVFAGGLMLWRYQLIASGRGEVFPTSTSAQIDSFIEFVTANCPESANIVYLKNKDFSSAYVSYTLYPRSLIDFPVDWTSLPDANEFISRVSEIRGRSGATSCLMVDHYAGPVPGIGERLIFNQNQFLVALEE